MPDTRNHRGPHQEDARLFDVETVENRLHAATDDLCWLLGRGYAAYGSIKLVGDRYNLLKRQRIAVARCACSENDRLARQQRMVQPSQAEGQPLWIDGYNVLTTIEAALAGGIVLAGRDGCWRDMASMHGSYRKVAETRPALELIARMLDRLQASECVWYLDRPVSNSGRLKLLILETAQRGTRNWQVELVADPDPVLSTTDSIVATADSVILDHCHGWLNLAKIVVENEVGGPWLVEL